MARYQYRMAGELDWMSNSGNAVWALFNPQGSGKKITLRSIEAVNKTSTTTGIAGSVVSAPGTILRFTDVAVFDGDPLKPLPMDTQAVWPSSWLSVTKSGIPVTVNNSTTGRYIVNKQALPSGLGWGTSRFSSNRLSALRNRPRGAGTGSTIEHITLRAAQQWGVVVDTLNNTGPVRVSATFIVNGSPDRTFMVSYYVNIQQVGQTLLTVRNLPGSPEILRIVDFSVEEVGTFDSPYFQLVPVGSIEASALSDPSKAVPLIKMDSTNPDPTPHLKALKDVPIQPFGMPENAIADASTGSPKGVNYLKTKDFLGPVFRTFFPEFVGADRRAVLPDALGYSTGHVQSDLFGREAGFVLNEGEGIALVSAAETAVLSTAVGTSGWMSWEFGAQIDVESKYAPTLILKGLKENTEVRVFRTSDDVELAGLESAGSFGLFGYEYDWDGVDTNVYIVIHALGFIPIRYTNQVLGKDGLTILVQQREDRQYSNL